MPGSVRKGLSVRIPSGIHQIEIIFPGQSISTRPGLDGFVKERLQRMGRKDFGNAPARKLARPQEFRRLRAREIHEVFHQRVRRIAGNVLRGTRPVEAQDHQHLGYQPRSEGGSASRPIRVSLRQAGKDGREHGPIDDRIQTGKRISPLVQFIESRHLLTNVP